MQRINFVQNKKRKRSYKSGRRKSGKKAYKSKRKQYSNYGNPLQELTMSIIHHPPITIVRWIKGDANQKNINGIEKKIVRFESNFQAVTSAGNVGTVNIATCDIAQMWNIGQGNGNDERIGNNITLQTCIYRIIMKVRMKECVHDQAIPGNLNFYEILGNAKNARVANADLRQSVTEWNNFPNMVMVRKYRILNTIHLHTQFESPVIADIGGQAVNYHLPSYQQEITLIYRYRGGLKLSYDANDAPTDKNMNKLPEMYYVQQNDNNANGGFQWYLVTELIYTDQ